MRKLFLILIVALTAISCAKDNFVTPVDESNHPNAVKGEGDGEDEEGYWFWNEEKGEWEWIRRTR